LGWLILNAAIAPMIGAMRVLMIIAIISQWSTVIYCFLRARREKNVGSSGSQ